MRVIKVFLVLSLFFIPATVLAVDTDADGLTDEQEAFYYTDPTNPDTDGDGYPDGIEVQNDFSPHAGSGVKMHEHDHDGDGLGDWVERWFGSDLGLADTDHDGLTDYQEIMKGNSPLPGQDSKKFPQKIQIDLTNQRVYYYVDRIKVFNVPVSTGNPLTPTPTGLFKIERKVENKRYVGRGYDYDNVKWNLQFKPTYYMHTAYWHNYFGLRTASHGCVNMREKDAKMLYDNVDIGVPVEVVGKTPWYWVKK